MSRLATAASMLVQRILDDPETVSYAAPLGTISVGAWLGSTPYEQTNEDGVVYRSESKDFIIPASSLTFDGSSYQPRAGDRIVHEASGTRYLYEVMSLGDEPPFRYCDPFKTLLRVHTKLVVGDS